MELQRIESLLLQEMEEVKGGTAGVCECTKGAGQGTGDEGFCRCTEGAGQLLDKPNPNPPECKCNLGAFQKNN